MKPIVTHAREIAHFSSLMSSLILVPPAPASESVKDYLDLELEALLSIEVTSVSKKKQRLNEVAAAVFVITQEDIRRSGVTSIPEALRLAPGIQVARIDANKWAISSRGFANQYANKLLVMIDGRSVYTPAYSGVYWDAQDTLLEDIDRIEVIRGPGATVWGANTVNGVINIITKQAGETQGGLLVAGAGNEEKGFASLRYGAEMGTDTYARVYLKYNDRDSSYAPGLDDEAGDDWQSLRGGFRVDGQATEADSWTIQGDVYDADENQTVNIWKDPTDPANAMFAPLYLAVNLPDTIDSSGWNLFGKWEHRISEHSSSSLQVYYDYAERREFLVNQTHKTLDIDVQHQFHAYDDHDVIWGMGYRRIEGVFDNTYMVSFLPDHRRTDLYSAFVQDEIELLPQTLRLTLGSKFEHNDFTGFEVQPNIRLVWLPDEHNTLWGSVSRAVRTPSGVEAGSKVAFSIVPLPPPFDPLAVTVLGNEAYESETLLAYEAGYRFQPIENLSFDLVLFYNDYDNLQSFKTADVPPFPNDLLFDNELSAHSYGIELAMDWRPLEWWRLQSSYSFLRVTGIEDDLSLNAEESSPKHQLSLRSMMDLSNKLSLDLWFYSVDDLKNTAISLDIPVEGYTSLNARLAWRAQKNLELSLVGQNLLDDRHMEFVAENQLIQTEVERSVYGKICWDF